MNIKTNRPEALNQRDGRQAVLVITFILSIFLSAVLLFSVQPMFTKLTLPLLGGASNVWNTAMVFFQGTLLAGYIYAHILSKYLPFKFQIGMHVLVMALGLFFLPLTLALGWEPASESAHALWLIALYAVSIGIPFFAISANAPLLQRWFSYTRHPQAEDPYFLYAASNAGSLLSLCLYPFIIEPLFQLQEQTAFWSYGYLLLIGFLIASGSVALVNRSAGLKGLAASSDIHISRKPKKRLLWIGLAFIPSSLMLGVTSHMTNNIASVPLLWIVPLSLYLLTFVIVFARKPMVSTIQLKRFFPFIPIIAIIAGFALKPWILISIGLSLVCYFIIALLCHSRMVDERPPPEYLTEFFICMSLGGVLGGIFNALVAPLIFSGTYEYLVVLLLVGLAVPQDTAKQKQRAKNVAIIAMSIFAAYIAFNHLSLLAVDPIITALCSGFILLLGFFAVQRNIPRALINSVAFASVFTVVVPIMSQNAGFKTIYQDRSFFGVIRVKMIETENGTLHNFVHGDTVHNFQLQTSEFKRTPLAYHGVGNAMESALSIARNRRSNLKVAVIGLGAGAMACYERSGDNWVYFEIDPAVVKMAQDPGLFSYMSECSFKNDVRIGDARQEIVKLQANSQDLIIIDAFSSDAVPTHLLTREALVLYIYKLKPDGFIFFHTSNRFMDVSSVVVRLAKDAGWESRYIYKGNFQDQPLEIYYKPSLGVLVARKQILEDATRENPDWSRLEPSKHVELWTDDYSPIIGTIISHRENMKQASSTD